jgi:TPR repeat protein
MRIAHILPELPFKIDKKHWWTGVLFFIVFVLASQIASLSSPGYIWDDLVWYWTYHVNGSKALFDLLDQVGHPAFWPFINFAYWRFGEHATFPTTIIALAFHAANSILIFNLMRYLKAGRVAAFLAFVFYLLSPYYFNRGTVCHHFYDVFMFFFLLSIYLGAPGQKSGFKRLVAAPVFQVLYFGLPTLVMLEPLRLAVHWELCKRDYRKTAGSIAIYWLVALACAVTAFIVFKPFGYYEGYNELKFNPGHLLEGILAYLLYLPKTLFFHAKNFFLVLMQPLDWPFVFLLALVAFFVIRSIPAPEKKRPKNNATLLLAGTALIFSGAVPYVLAGRLPEPSDFNSRLFFVSGLGLVMVMSVALGMIHSSRLRVLTASVLIGVFLVSGLQQAKAYMFDHLVRQSILADLRSGEGDSAMGISDQNMFVVLASEPPLWELFTQRRTVTPMEFSVPMNIQAASGHSKWFIYNYDARDFSPPDYFIPPRECSLAAHDRHPCPAYYVVAVFRLDQDKALAKLSFPGLFYQSLLANKPESVGRLEFTTEPRPMNTDEMAVRWYRKNAADGISGAQNTLGLMYLEGFMDVPQDDHRAFELFRKATDQGMLDARLNLGVMYLEGRGVEKNEGLAVRLIDSAAREGYAKAEYNLGVLYDQGRGVPRSEGEAFKWYLKAAEQDHMLAQTQVGLRYARGVGVPHSDTEAIRWLRRAAAKREKIAQYALGIMLAEGRGAARDIQTAAILLEGSANQGYPKALYSLGYLYEHGIAVPKSAAESYFWYQLASRHGDGEERNAAGKPGVALGQSLNAAERRALDKRVKEWRPATPKKPPMWH